MSCSTASLVTGCSLPEEGRRNFGVATPNPFIERTSSSKVRLLPAAASIQLPYPPSSGHPAANFACRWLPLMSNVRRHEVRQPDAPGVEVAREAMIE